MTPAHRADFPRPKRALASMPNPDASMAYFFDFDGTLVDIAPSPSSVRLEEGLRDAVMALHRATGGAVALVSGRPLRDLDVFFPGTRLAMAGQHGIERRDASGHVSCAGLSGATLDGARRQLADIVTRHPGLLLEDKGLSLALHYRQVPRLGGYAGRLMRALQAGLGQAYGIQTGKCVVEIRPTAADKGDAISHFMTHPPFRGRMPVFVGDDRTDEDGFAAVNRLGGLSIKVGPGRTLAKWRLAGVEGVRRWLEQFDQARRNKGNNG